MSGLEIVVAIAIAVGLIGILVPILPGVLLILLAVLVWATDIGSATGWGVFAAAAVLLVAGGIAKYVLPGRRLKDAGIPSTTQWTGVGFGVVGFFVVPVLGLFLGFILGMYVAERRRLGPEAAGPSTRVALAAVGLSILIELTSGVLATGAWIFGVVVT